MPCRKPASTFTVYVFKKQEDAYVLSDSVTGHGLSVQSVEYPLFQKEGHKGIAIAWGLEDGQTSALTLCDFDSEGRIKTLLNTDFMNYRLCDLTGDGADELLVLSAERAAALYQYQNGRIAELGRASVSREAVSIVRLTTGYLAGGIPAVFAEERPDTGTGLMTDIFVYGEGQLHNISQNTESGASSGSYRAMNVYAADIDGDHVTEIPRTVLMQGFSDPNAPEALYLLDWYAYDMSGQPTLKRTTYHNISEEWSFRCPEEWRGRVTATKDAADGVSRTTFFEYVAGGENRALFTVYCCTGEQAARYAAQSQLTPLSETNSAYYAASIADSGSPLSITAEDLQGRFKLLTSEWMG